MQCFLYTAVSLFSRITARIAATATSMACVMSLAACSLSRTTACRSWFHSICKMVAQRTCRAAATVNRAADSISDASVPAAFHACQFWSRVGATGMVSGECCRRKNPCTAPRRYDNHMQQHVPHRPGVPSIRNPAPPEMPAACIPAKCPPCGSLLWE